MPMLVVLEGEHIDKQLEVVHRRITDHLYVVIDIDASDFLEVLSQTVKTTLHTIAVRVILNGRFATNLYRKINTIVKMWHELITGTQLNVVADGRS